MYIVQDVKLVGLDQYYMVHKCK